MECGVRVSVECGVRLGLFYWIRHSGMEERFAIKENYYRRSISTSAKGWSMVWMKIEIPTTAIPTRTCERKVVNAAIILESGHSEISESLLTLSSYLRSVSNEP